LLTPAGRHADTADMAAAALLLVHRLYIDLVRVGSAI
jgi:hypothetical protein